MKEFENYHIAYSFGNKLTFNQIIDLWRTAVTEVLIIENINYLYELPYGKGYMMATEKWENLLKEAAMVHGLNADEVIEDLKDFLHQAEIQNENK